MSRRSHVKRAKILRGKNYRNWNEVLGGSDATYKVRNWCRKFQTKHKKRWKLANAICAAYR